VDRTKELEPLAAEPPRPIGWEGRTAHEMLAYSERLFADTGRYCGVDDLAMKATDPMKAFGAVIGKALGRLSDGRGVIPVLEALQ